MVAFTGNSLVSLHPKLTMERIGLATKVFLDDYYELDATFDADNIERDLVNIGNQFLLDNSSWQRSCGLECPSLFRSSTNGLGVIALVNGVFDTTLQTWFEAEGLWRIGSECVNPYCSQD